MNHRLTVTDSAGNNPFMQTTHAGGQTSSISSSPSKFETLNFIRWSRFYEIYESGF